MLVHQEDITILNLQTPNNIASKYTEQKLVELKRVDKSTIIAADFNISFFFLKISLLEYNFFTMFVSFCCTTNKVNQLYVYIYPHIPISPPSCISLPHSLSHPLIHPSRWSQSTELIFLCYAAASHQLSILHLVVYKCQCYSLTLSQLPPLPPCPQVHSLRLHLYCCPATRFISTVF